MPLSSGSRLASYEIISLIGSGGIGDVYKAKDLKLGRTVAVKVLPKELASDPGRLRRLEQEARAASALDHPNIVTIHDISEVDGVHFIVMQYVEGRMLGELGCLEIARVLDYGVRITDGLARAHSRGIVHPSSRAREDIGFLSLEHQRLAGRPLDPLRTSRPSRQ